MTNKDTRSSHKDEVREQKAAAARAARRASTTRRIAIIVVLVALVGGGVMLLTQQREETQTAAGPSSSPVSLAPAECDEPTNVGPFPDDKDQSHDGLSPLSEYPSAPPASGPHSEDTVSAGTYEEPVDLAAAIHSLEHGAVVIWYDPSVAGSPELAQVRTFIEENKDHAVLSPYDYPDEGAEGSLPKGTTMTLTAWHWVQNCGTPGVDAVSEFMSGYRTPPLGDADYIGEAPEPNVPI